METMIDMSTSISLARGEQILRDPLRNKDAAFTQTERIRFGLSGLLPSAVLTIKQQLQNL